MSERATQNARVLDFIREHGSVSPAQTLRWQPPITRLAARIADLRAAGHAIVQVGKDGKFAKYGFVTPLRGNAPGKKEPACYECGRSLVDLTPGLAPGFLVGRCGAHGLQPVPAA